MKTKFIPLIFLFVAMMFVVIFINRQTEVEAKDYEYLRIHINANSCSDLDKEIKYEIRDKVVNFLSNSLADCSDKAEAMKLVDENLSSIEALISVVIKENNLTYGAKVELKNEYFPSRCYENCVLEAGLYDALIITLGEGGGDNWWCVMYPPMCFVNKNSQDEQNMVYQSKIADWIKRYF